MVPNVPQRASITAKETQENGYPQHSRVSGRCHQRHRRGRRSFLHRHGLRNDPPDRQRTGHRSSISATAMATRLRSISSRAMSSIRRLSIGGSNVSNNSTINNVAIGNGNNSSTTVTASSGTTAGGTTGNGNTTQIDILSGNIFNPQISIGGSNVEQQLHYQQRGDRQRQQQQHYGHRPVVWERPPAVRPATETRLRSTSSPGTSFNPQISIGGSNVEQQLHYQQRGDRQRQQQQHYGDVHRRLWNDSQRCGRSAMATRLRPPSSPETSSTPS